MPCSRSAASLARRSAIRWFSSTAGCGFGVWSVMVSAGSWLSWVRLQPLAPGWNSPRRASRTRSKEFAAGGSPAGSVGLYRVGTFRARLQAGLQARLHELVQVAIEHLLRVGTLEAGAQVLDAALVEHVVADLAAPADVGF